MVRCREMSVWKWKKELHFKKLMDFDTIGGKSNKNGARFDLDAMYVNWLGLSKNVIFQNQKIV